MPRIVAPCCAIFTDRSRASLMHPLRYATLSVCIFDQLRWPRTSPSRAPRSASTRSSFASYTGEPYSLHIITIIAIILILFRLAPSTRQYPCHSRTETPTGFAILYISPLPCRTCSPLIFFHVTGPAPGFAGYRYRSKNWPGCRVALLWVEMQNSSGAMAMPWRRPFSTQNQPK